MPVITDISPEVLRDRHRLSSRQINALFGGRIMEEIPEEKAACLEKVGEFIRVTDALREADIEFIPLKGPILSYRLYGDPSVRYFHDLDILIAPTETGHAKTVLENNGYVSAERVWPEDKNRQRRLLRYHHDIIFIHQVKQIKVELHWRLRHRQGLDDKKADLLIKQNLSETEYYGRSFKVLDSEMELLYLVMHGGSHQWGRLNWLHDVIEFMKTHEINEMKFRRLADDFHAGRFIALCNAVMTEYFPGAVTLPGHTSLPAYMVRLTGERITADEYPGPFSVKKSIQNLRFSLIAYPGVTYKFKVIGNIIFNR